MKFSPSTKGFYLEAIHGDNIPSDAVEITNEEHAALLAGQSAGKIITAGPDGVPYLADPAPVVLTQEQEIAKYEAALDAHLDSVAQQHRYRDRVTFSLRAGYPGPYQAEGIAFAQWMDACNVQAFTLLGKVLAHTAQLPTIEDFIAGLPVFVKP